MKEHVDRWNVILVIITTGGRLWRFASYTDKQCRCTGRSMDNTIRYHELPQKLATHFLSSDLAISKLLPHIGCWVLGLFAAGH